MTTLGSVNARIMGDGVVKVLVFTCSKGHEHGVPFHDAPPGSVTFDDGKTRLVWQRRGGSTITDLSLWPSYDSGCLHVWILGGRVVPA